MNVAVIPARGGSKRIPRKNIKEFCGKPMIAWSIEAALESSCFDQVIVSTEDAEIARVAEAWGAQVPFRRPEELADDYVGTKEVMQSAVQWLYESGNTPKYACCIYATAPFLNAQDIRRGLESIITENAHFALAVATFPYPIQRAVRVTSSNRLEMFFSEHICTRSQDLENAYHDAAQFCWGKSEAWLGDEPVFSNNSVPVILPRYRVQDIDTSEDWENAEYLFRVLHQKDQF